MLSVVQFGSAAIVCTAAGLVFEHVSTAQLLAAFPYLLVLGGLSTGVAFFLQTFAQQHTPASEAALLTGAESIFGMLGGMVFLKEFPSLSRRLRRGSHRWRRGDGTSFTLTAP